MVCGQNVMIQGTIRHWCKMFKDGRTNVHDEEQSGQPCVASDDLVQSADQRISERQCPNLHMNFPKVHALFSMRLSQV
jgi:hypothetical protein